MPIPPDSLGWDGLCSGCFPNVDPDHHGFCLQLFDVLQVAKGQNNKETTNRLHFQTQFLYKNKISCRVSYFNFLNAAHRPASTGQTVWRAPGRLQDTRRQGFARRPNNTSKMLIAVSLAYLVLVFPLGVIQTVELCWNVHHKPPSVLHHSPDESEESCLQNYVHWYTQHFLQLFKITLIFFKYSNHTILFWIRKSTKLLLKYIRSFCFGFYQINFAINFFLYFAAGLQFRLHLQHKMKCFLNRFPPRLLLWCHGTIDDRDCSGEHCAGGTSGRITVTRLFRSKTTTPATSRASVSTTSVRCIDENSEPACSNLPSGNPTEEEVAVRTLSGVISTDDAALSSESIRLGVLGQPATDLDTDMQSCEETISDF